MASGDDGWRLGWLSRSPVTWISSQWEMEHSLGRTQANALTLWYDVAGHCSNANC